MFSKNNLALAIAGLLAATASANEMPPELPFKSVSEPTSSAPLSKDDINAIKSNASDTTPPTNTAKTPANIPQNQPSVTVKPKAAPALKKPHLPGSATTQESGILIRPQPGKTHSAAIARNRLNRIVTPYAEPKVLTVDPIETKIDGSAIYVATESEAPVSLFISDGEGSQAVSLELIPEDISKSVEIRLEATAQTGKDAVPATDQAGSLRGDHPYIDEIKSIMQSMARQQVPQGYTLENMSKAMKYTEICRAPGLAYTLGQVLTGQGSVLMVYVAQNRGTSPTVIDESACATSDVMAVAVWPKVRLSPGAKTEVYVLMRAGAQLRDEQLRPSLLKDGGA